MSEMTEEDFLRAALDALSEETLAAGRACAAAGLGRRLTPIEVMKIADALGAKRAPVLALMGWISAREDRPNRRVFYDVLIRKVPSSEAMQPTDRESLFALAVCRGMKG